jgi:D-alanyl-D-alanine carboxypeptidase
MTLAPQQDAFLRDVVLLLQYAWHEGFAVTGGELYRTEEQEAIYVANGRSSTMNSMHLQKLAIDLNFIWAGSLLENKGALQKIGEFWKSLGPHNRWGGDWEHPVDAGHFERRPV